MLLSHFWHGIGSNISSSDLFKEYLSKLLLETGSRGIRPVSFFLYLPYPSFNRINKYAFHY